MNSFFFHYFYFLLPLPHGARPRGASWAGYHGQGIHHNPFHMKSSPTEREFGILTIDCTTPLKVPLTSMGRMTARHQKPRVTSSRSLTCLLAAKRTTIGTVALAFVFFPFFYQWALLLDIPSIPERSP
ncbi:hypothetical protein BC940DRAFT_57426 [Gongronella butleri]|nr:hypothetical protein BC940DRAFT_57426 [Gongronella butleri]